MLAVEQNCEQNCSFVLFFEFFDPVRRQKQEQNRDFCFQFFVLQNCEQNVMLWRETSLFLSF